MSSAPCVGFDPRLSGTSTATMVLPSGAHSTVVTRVARSGVFVTCTDFPLATSATNRCDAVLVLPTYATWVPLGDQAADVAITPFGTSSALVLPVRGSTS